MPKYKVVWEIELDAPDAVSAAKLAREIQLDPESIATVFTVTPIIKAETIDLSPACSDNGIEEARTRQNRYKVVLKSIEWDREYSEEASDPFPLLPKEAQVNLWAPDEQVAIEWALDTVSNNFGFCIQGSTPEVTQLEGSD